MKTKEKSKELIARVKRIIEYYGDTDNNFADRIGISKSNLSSMLSGQRVIGEGIINKIILNTEFRKDWLLSGTGDPVLHTVDVNVSPENTKNRVALYAGSVEGGTNTTIQDSPDYIEGYVQVDGIGANDGSWVVSGHSMHPTISKGSRVVIRKIENMDLIVWNEIYVVDLKEHGAKVKRVRPGATKGKLLLASDHPDYAPFEVDLKRDVLGVYRVLMHFEML